MRMGKGRKLEVVLDRSGLFMGMATAQGYVNK
jgi:hypothetical protein